MRDDPRVTRVGALCCAGSRSTSCPSCSTCSAARCRWSARVRRCPREVARYDASVSRRLLVKPGPDRAVADLRAQRPPLGGGGPARPALRRELVARAGPADPLEDRPRRPSRGSGGVLTATPARRVTPGGDGVPRNGVTDPADRAMLACGRDDVAEEAAARTPTRTDGT